MRIHQETEKIAPLALDCWRPEGPNSYIQARDVITQRVDESQLPSRLKTIAALALDMRLARQAERNSTHFANLTKQIVEGVEQPCDDYERLISGEASPTELVQFLQRYPIVGAVEIARLTHVGDWESRDVIDYPVRSELDQSSDTIGTRYQKSDVTYKVAQMDVDNQAYATIYRSRVMRSQFGGAAYVIAQGNMLLDISSPDMPDELREHIHDLDKETRDPKGRNVYKIPSLVVAEHVEPVVKTANNDDAPAWVFPLGTTYRDVTRKELGARIVYPLDGVRTQ